MIKLIIFDLWKTLATTKNQSMVQTIISTFNLDMEKKEVKKIYETTYQTKEWNSKNDASSELCKNMGISSSKENVHKFEEVLNSSLKNVELFPHTLPMLNKLKQDYKIGLISNTSIFAVKILKENTKLFDYIDYPLLSFEIGLVKPNPKIFEEMLKRAKCNPKEAMMIGDNFDDDVAPAKSLGMHAIHFQSYEQLKNDLAEFGIKVN